MVRLCSAAQCSFTTEQRADLQIMWWCRAVKFFVVWTGQAVWIWVTLLPVLILNATEWNPRLRWTDVVGGIIWGAGFVCELTADLQKQQWRKDPAHKGRFINVGDARPFGCIRQ